LDAAGPVVVIGFQKEEKVNTTSFYIVIISDITFEGCPFNPYSYILLLKNNLSVTSVKASH